MLCRTVHSLIRPPCSGWDIQAEDHVLRSGNTEPITTLFCWHGFQYVRVQLLPGNLMTHFKGGLNDITGLAIHTNMTQTGSLEFGGGGDRDATHAAAVLSGINEMTLQSQRTNVAGTPCTCIPSRHGTFGAWHCVMTSCVLSCSHRAFGPALPLQFSLHADGLPGKKRHPHFLAMVAI